MRCPSRRGQHGAGHRSHPSRTPPRAHRPPGTGRAHLSQGDSSRVLGGTNLGAGYPPYHPQPTRTPVGSTRASRPTRTPVGSARAPPSPKPPPRAHGVLSQRGSPGPILPPPPPQGHSSPPLPGPCNGRGTQVGGVGPWGPPPPQVRTRFPGGLWRGGGSGMSHRAPRGGARGLGSHWIAPPPTPRPLSPAQGLPPLTPVSPTTATQGRDPPPRAPSMLCRPPPPPRLLPPPWGVPSATGVSRVVPPPLPKQSRIRAASPG